MKVVGGIAPFGYRWHGGKLVVDNDEAPVRVLIYELFVKHRRKRTVAKLLNDLGHRTRNGSFFSDTTIDRLLKDTTARGTRVVNGKAIEVEPIISTELWKRVDGILGGGKPARESHHLFSGLAYCDCGGRMIVLSDRQKYVCIDCRHKILADDVEAIFHSQLKKFESFEGKDLYVTWNHLSSKEKRIVTEQICDRIEIGKDIVNIEFSCSFSLSNTLRNGDKGEDGNQVSVSAEHHANTSSFSEPLLSEAEAARFMGISKMTVLRKRNAGQIGYFRVGFRVLYSKEKHLLPFLNDREKTSRVL